MSRKNSSSSSSGSESPRIKFNENNYKIHNLNTNSDNSTNIIRNNNFINDINNKRISYRISNNFKKLTNKCIISFIIGIIIGSLIFNFNFQKFEFNFNTDRFNNGNNNDNENNNNKKINQKEIDRIYLKEYQNSEFYINNNRNRGDEEILHDSNPFNHLITYNRLIKAFPYTEEDSDPENNKNIIQMWLKEKEIIGSKNKVDIMTNEENKLKDIPYEDHRKTWIEKNPNYNYKLYTYKEINDLFKLRFSDTVPEVLEAYNLLPHIILKSDLGRYFLLYLIGGVYSDIDTNCHRSIDEWYDNIDQTKYNIGISVSIEDDVNRDNWHEFKPRRVELLQWAFKGNRKHHFWALLISKIVETTFRAKYEGRLQAWSSYQNQIDKCSGVDILDWTGPGVFTDAFIEYVNLLNEIEITDVEFEKSYGMKIFDQVVGPITEIKEVGNEKGVLLDNKGWNFNWKGLIALTGPRIINDLMILPYAFEAPDECPGYDDLAKLCYIHHSYSGAWKNNN
ncbi:hypothetical protein B5S31_g2660 [[Candida] boidinii]|nr:hypothetical protein B5S31_g2660 [[Candida] boidinii]